MPVEKYVQLNSAKNDTGLKKTGEHRHSYSTRDSIAASNINLIVANTLNEGSSQYLSVIVAVEWSEVYKRLNHHTRLTFFFTL